MKLLVIGGDSLIGGALLQGARDLAWEAAGTTRRPGVAEMTYLDLSVRAPIPQRHYDAAILCAAMSRHDQCAADPYGAFRANVEGPARIAEALSAMGTHIVFLSTDSVFGAANCLRRESDASAPGNGVYPALKAKAEAALSESVRPEHLAIVRMTKVVSVQREPFRTWCSGLRAGARIEGLSDLLFCPISLRYAAQALLQLAAGAHQGVFHLSGERDLSYAEFAWELSARAGGASQVVTRRMAEAGVQPAYRPVISRLGMARTNRVAGLFAQPVTAVVDDLMREAQTLQSGMEADTCVA